MKTLQLDLYGDVGDPARRALANGFLSAIVHDSAVVHGILKHLGADLPATADFGARAALAVIRAGALACEKRSALLQGRRIRFQKARSRFRAFLLDLPVLSLIHI